MPAVEGASYARCIDRTLYVAFVISQYGIKFPNALTCIDLNPDRVTMVPGTIWMSNVNRAWSHMAAR